MESFTTRSTSKKCPRFTKPVFEALKVIQPSLQVFLQLTQVYSEVGANSYRIIPDLVGAIEELQKINYKPHVAKSRKASCKVAVDKLQKYLNKFLKNRWTCAAFALDPTVREAGLELLLTEEYNAEYLLDGVLRWIELGIEWRGKDLPQDAEDDEVKWVRKPQRVNKFASTRFQSGQQEITHDTSDPWQCYNSGLERYDTIEGEPVLAYWKRMSEFKEMRALAEWARDILGLASSSASVERLFSHAGHILGKKRGSLSSELLSKQTMLRMWQTQGLLEDEDL